jgi:hypothetical protein
MVVLDVRDSLASQPISVGHGFGARPEKIVLRHFRFREKPRYRLLVVFCFTVEKDMNYLHPQFDQTPRDQDRSMAFERILFGTHERQNMGFRTFSHAIQSGAKGRRLSD